MSVCEALTNPFSRLHRITSAFTLRTHIIMTLKRSSFFFYSVLVHTPNTAHDMLLRIKCIFMKFIQDSKRRKSSRAVYVLSVFVCFRWHEERCIVVFSSHFRRFRYFFLFSYIVFVLQRLGSHSQILVWNDSHSVALAVATAAMHMLRCTPQHSTAQQSIHTQHRQCYPIKYIFTYIFYRTAVQSRLFGYVIMHIADPQPSSAHPPAHFGCVYRG